jgi:sugar/nucleoside kinase (ribokinase family)
MKPTCFVAGLFNDDTFVTKETADGPEQIVSREVGGTGGVVSKLMASLGWTTMPVCRFDESAEGKWLHDGLAAYGCDMRYVTNLPDGGTTILSIVLTKRPDGSYKQRIFRSNSRDKERGFDSRYPRWKFVKIADARRIVEGLDVPPDVFFFDAPAPGHREMARLLREKGTLVYFEPFPTKDGRSMKCMEVADIVKFSKQDFPDVSFVEKYPNKLFIQTLGGPEGARFRFPGCDWQTVPGFPNEEIASPLGCGDWTTVGLLTTLWRSGGVKFSDLTPERVAFALSEGQRYASRNCSYITTCSDELLDELGVRGIVQKPLESVHEELAEEGMKSQSLLAKKGSFCQ